MSREIGPVPRESPVCTPIGKNLKCATEAKVQADGEAHPARPVQEAELGGEQHAQTTYVWVAEPKRPEYRVVDRFGGEVVAQMPSEGAVARHIDEMLDRSTQGQDWTPSRKG